VTMASSAGRQLSGASIALYRRQGGPALANSAGRSGRGSPWRVNAIASTIVTERLAALPDEARRRIAEGFPLKRLGEVDDVVAGTLFLLSDAATWITGVTLDVAGGRVMR
jgi:3-oxoacyl-[acyl-carrier protein] reductase